MTKRTRWARRSRSKVRRIHHTSLFTRDEMTMVGDLRYRTSMGELHIEERAPLD